MFYEYMLTYLVDSTCNQYPFKYIIKGNNVHKRLYMYVFIRVLFIIKMYMHMVTIMIFILCITIELILFLLRILVFIMLSKLLKNKIND